jgi:signal peptidase I
MGAGEPYYCMERRGAGRGFRQGKDGMTAEPIILELEAAARPLRPEIPLAREPWLAAGLSLLLPGLGHLYSGARWTGAGLALAFLLAVGTAAASILLPQGHLWVAGLATLAAAGLVGVCPALAYRAARRRNSPEAEGVRRASRDPFLAVFLTLLLPGLGHLYLRRRWKGLLLIGLTVGALLLPGGLFFLGLSVYTSLACLLAWQATGPDRRNRWRGLAAVCLVLLVTRAGLVGGLLFTAHHWVKPFQVAMTSMAPTLHADDGILVWRAGYRPARGDVVTLRSPIEDGEIYVKRVAAVEGETIEIRRDGVYVNGRRLDDGVWGRLRYRPEADQQYAWPGCPLTVPPGCVFVLGDNGRQSMDSRYFGPVSISAVVGKAYKRFWPPSQFGPIE